MRRLNDRLALDVIERELVETEMEGELFRFARFESDTLEPLQQTHRLRDAGSIVIDIELREPQSPPLSPVFLSVAVTVTSAALGSLSLALASGSVAALTFTFE